MNTKGCSLLRNHRAIKSIEVKQKVVYMKAVMFDTYLKASPYLTFLIFFL